MLITTPFTDPECGRKNQIKLYFILQDRAALLQNTGCLVNLTVMQNKKQTDQTGFSNKQYKGKRFNWWKPCMAWGCLVHAREKSLHSLFQSKTNWSEDNEYMRERKHLWISVENDGECSTAATYLHDTPNPSNPTSIPQWVCLLWLHPGVSQVVVSPPWKIKKGKI